MEGVVSCLVGYCSILKLFWTTESERKETWGVCLIDRLARSNLCNIHNSLSL